MKKYAILVSDVIVAFPVHETCVPDELMSYEGAFALEIALTAHRTRENCISCNRPVCGAGKVPQTIMRAGNDWDFVRKEVEHAS